MDVPRARRSLEIVLQRLEYIRQADSRADRELYVAEAVTYARNVQRYLQPSPDPMVEEEPREVEPREVDSSVMEAIREAQQVAERASMRWIEDELNGPDDEPVSVSF